MSAGDTGSAAGSRRAGSRASAKAAACRRIAGPLRPDTRTGTGVAAPAAGLAGTVLAGCSPRTTWQLVPPRPNEETPAMDGSERRGHVPRTAHTCSRFASRSIAGLGSR
ncbi:hypothetical protein V6574_00940 [Streptomyces sp. SM1P]